LRAQRAETAAWIVDGLTTRSPLRSETDRDQAIDTVWLLMDPHGFCALTQHRGWTPERFGRWFSDSVQQLILAPVDPEPTVLTVRTSSPSQPSANTPTHRSHSA
jgi:hypothetical protein